MPFITTDTAKSSEGFGASRSNGRTRNSAGLGCRMLADQPASPTRALKLSGSHVEAPHDQDDQDDQDAKRVPSMLLGQLLVAYISYVSPPQRPAAGDCCER